MAGRLRNPTHERFANLIALGHLGQAASFLEAVGPTRAKKLSQKSLSTLATRMSRNVAVQARVDEIRAQNEQECRWSRRQLLDFYCECLERGAGTLTASDPLCQGVEKTTVTHFNGKGKPVRTIVKERLIMPTKVDCADGLRKMLGWDKKQEALPDDDISELLLLIRRKSSHAIEPSEKTISTQELEVLSSTALPPIPDGATTSFPAP